MREEDDEWILDPRGDAFDITINGNDFKNVVSDNACIAHAILLLADSMKDISYELHKIRRQLER
jgi:hypothetical protein